MKKTSLKKVKPIERVYRDGREAIVKATRKKTLNLKTPSRIAGTLKHAPVISPAAKTAAPQKQFSPIRINEYELPSYNTTRIALIVKDPFWIYAYWDISQDCIESVKRQLGGSLDGARFVIRMYDVTMIDFNGNNAHSWYDIEVGPHTNNWYINLWRDNVSYCAEIGIRADSGRFFSLARSNFVNTPRASSSQRFDQVWMEVKNDFNFHKSTSTWKDGSPRANTYRGPSRSILSKRKIYLNEDDLREYYSKLSPLLMEIMLSRIARRRIYRYMGSKSDRERLAEFYMRSLSGGKFLRKILLGSSEFMFLGGSESIHQASEFVLPEKKRKFFFEIGTELIVYGRTEPDAEVWLGDKKIPLHSDGTFSLRFHLPDGKIPMDFTAVSNDKVDKRKILTIVERNTQ